MITEIVYKGHDNRINLLLKADGNIVDLSPVTKMELVLDNDEVISSDTYPSAFDWTSGSTGELILDLGDVVNVGNYVAWLVVYDSTNTDGIVWDKFHLVVREV